MIILFLTMDSFEGGCFIQPNESRRIESASYLCLYVSLSVYDKVWPTLTKTDKRPSLWTHYLGWESTIPHTMYTCYIITAHILIYSYLSSYIWKLRSIIQGYAVYLCYFFIGLVYGNGPLNRCVQRFTVYKKPLFRRPTYKEVGR